MHFMSVNLHHSPVKQVLQSAFYRWENRLREVKSLAQDCSANNSVDGIQIQFCSKPTFLPPPPLAYIAPLWSKRKAGKLKTFLKSTKLPNLTGAKRHVKQILKIWSQTSSIRISCSTCLKCRCWGDTSSLSIRSAWLEVERGHVI